MAVHRGTRAMIAGLVLAAALAGCGAPQPATPVAVSGEMVDLATRSGSWPATEDDLQNAFAGLDRRCLRDQGIAAPATEPAALPVPEDESAAIDLATRRSVGYGLSHPDGSAAAEPASAGGEEFLAAQFGAGRPMVDVTIHGDESVQAADGGCVAEAHRRLAGSVATWTRLFYLPQWFDDRLYATMLGDPRHERALGSWRSCMRARGFWYVDPDRAESDLREQYAKGATSALRHREVSVAVADGECQAAVHLPATLLRIRRSLVARLPRADLELLATTADRRRAAVDRARSVPTG
jgi:hypothetical protein